MDVLSHPFRLGPTGRAVTVTEGTDEAHGESIAVVALTRKGERPLVPTFGVTDPVFSELDVAELNAVLRTHGPPVTVTDLDVEFVDDRTARAVLTFEELTA